MEHYCLFAPMKPSRDYPTSPFNVRVGTRDYDLPLTPEAAGYIAQEVTSEANEYFRSSAFSSPSGILRLRDQPGRIYFEATRPACFAEGVIHEPVGSGLRVAQVLVVSRELCAALLVNSWDRMPDIELAATGDIRRYTDYFSESGGFELLRIWYYMSKAERDDAIRIGDQPVFDFSSSRTRFLREAQR